VDVHDRSVDRQAVPDSRGDEPRIPAGGAQCVQPSGVCDSSHLGERRQLRENYWDGGWTARDAAGIQVQLLKAVVGRSSFVVRQWQDHYAPLLAGEWGIFLAEINSELTTGDTEGHRVLQLPSAFFLARSIDQSDSLQRSFACKKPQAQDDSVPESYFRLVQASRLTWQMRPTT